MSDPTIIGYITEKGEPYISALLVSRKLNIRSPIRLLVNTGATATTITYADAARLGIDYSKLRKAKVKAAGVGRVADVFIVDDAFLIFPVKEGGFYTTKVELHVLKGRVPKEALALPSVLGRDVMNRFKLTVDFVRKRVDLS